MPSEMKLFVTYDASNLGVFLVCSCDTGVTVSFWPGSVNFPSIYLFKFKFYFKFWKPVTQLFFINQKWHVICEMKSKLALA